MITRSMSPGLDALLNFHSAHNLCSDADPLGMCYQQFKIVLSLARQFTDIHHSLWKPILQSLQKFTREELSFITHYRERNMNDTTSLNDRCDVVSREFHKLDCMGFFYAFSPSLSTACVMSALYDYIGIEKPFYQRAFQPNFNASSPPIPFRPHPKLNDFEVKVIMRHLQTVMRSVNSLYTCIEQIVLSPPQSACPIFSIRQAASLCHMSRPTPSSAMTSSATSDGSRFSMILSARREFLNRLNNAPDVPETRKTELRKFLSALLDTVFFNVSDMPWNAMRQKVNATSRYSTESHIDDHFIKHETYKCVLPFRDGTNHVLFSPQVALKTYRLTNAHRKCSAQFYDAVFRLRALEHRCLVTLHGAYWPFPDATDPPSPVPKIERAIIVAEHMSVNLGTANALGVLHSRRARVQILSNILSAIVCLHEAGVRHSAVNARTVLLRLYQGAIHGRAKLDLPQLVEAVIAPPQLSQMSIDELMFRSPESMRRDGVDYLTGDVWSFGLLVCLLLSGRRTSSIMDEDYALLFLGHGPIRMAERWVKDIDDGSIATIISHCFQENPMMRITSFELAKQLEPIFNQCCDFSMFDRSDVQQGHPAPPHRQEQLTQNLSRGENTRQDMLHLPSHSANGNTSVAHIVNSVPRPLPTASLHHNNHVAPVASPHLISSQFMNYTPQALPTSTVIRNDRSGLQTTPCITGRHHHPSCIPNSTKTGFPRDSPTHASNSQGVYYTFNPAAVPPNAGVHPVRAGKRADPGSTMNRMGQVPLGHVASVGNASILSHSPAMLHDNNVAIPLTRGSILHAPAINHGLVPNTNIPPPSVASVGNAGIPSHSPAMLHNDNVAMPLTRGSILHAPAINHGLAPNANIPPPSNVRNDRSGTFIPISEFIPSTYLNSHRLLAHTNIPPLRSNALNDGTGVIIPPTGSITNASVSNHGLMIPARSPPLPTVRNEVTGANISTSVSIPNASMTNHGHVVHVCIPPPSSNLRSDGATNIAPTSGSNPNIFACNDGHVTSKQDANIPKVRPVSSDPLKTVYEPPNSKDIAIPSNCEETEQIAKKVGDEQPGSDAIEGIELENTFGQKLRHIASRGWKPSATAVENNSERKDFKVGELVNSTVHDEDTCTLDQIMPGRANEEQSQEPPRQALQGVTDYAPTKPKNDHIRATSNLCNEGKRGRTKKTNKRRKRNEKKDARRRSDSSISFDPTLEDSRDTSDLKAESIEADEKVPKPANLDNVWQGRTRHQKRRLRYVYSSSIEEGQGTEKNGSSRDADHSDEIVFLQALGGDDIPRQLSPLNQGEHISSCASNLESKIERFNPVRDEGKFESSKHNSDISLEGVSNKSSRRRRQNSSTAKSSDSLLAKKLITPETSRDGSEMRRSTIRSNRGVKREGGTQLKKGACFEPGWYNLQGGTSCKQPASGSAADFQTAVIHFNSAIAAGNIKAKVQLGQCYENGHGVEKDVVRARVLYMEAADANEESAFFDAGRCYEEGIGLPKNTEKAFEYFLRGATCGKEDAMFRVAKMYENGIGTTASLPSAFQMYRKSADAGHVEAKVAVAGCYGKGRGVKRQIQKAVEYYRDAANCGNASAMLSLGLLHEDGNGVRKNIDQALRLYKKSADLGHGPGITALGQCYVWAYGVTGDYKKARELFLKAAKKGHGLAYHELGMLHKEGHGVGKDMDKAAKYFRDGSENECEVAMVQLGDCLYHGNGVVQNFKTAFLMFEQAAERGAAEGYRWLGDCYADGSGVDQNAKKAVEMYKRGADMGSVTARTSLGSCYENGVGVAVNSGRALSMYRRAAECGDSNAENNLGILCESGKLVKKDFVKAVQHYRRAIQLGSTEAMCNLADSYASGNGVAKSMSTAIKWYSEGAKHGLAGAQCELGVCYYEGKGVERNIKRAIELFEASCDREAEAKRQLGRAYCDGWGVERDPKKGLKLTMEAADEGANTDACYDVGLIYDHGNGVEKDEEKAIEYYHRAATGGNSLAMAALGNICFSRQQHSEAAKWFTARFLNDDADQ